ncbi:MAG: hypothetical protein AB7I24_16310 [Candidatus Nanopelagicales bacterium]
MTGPSPELSAEVYNRFLQGIRLREVVTLRVLAERTGPGQAAGSQFNIQGGFSLEESR